MGQLWSLRSSSWKTLLTWANAAEITAPAVWSTYSVLHWLVLGWQGFLWQSPNVCGTGQQEVLDEHSWQGNGSSSVAQVPRHATSLPWAKSHFLHQHQELPVLRSPKLLRWNHEQGCPLAVGSLRDALSHLFCRWLLKSYQAAFPSLSWMWRTKQDIKRFTSYCPAFPVPSPLF